MLFSVHVVSVGKSRYMQAEFRLCFQTASSAVPGMRLFYSAFMHPDRQVQSRFAERRLNVMFLLLVCWKVRNPAGAGGDERIPSSCSVLREYCDGDFGIIDSPRRPSPWFGECGIPRACVVKSEIQVFLRFV
jgi:hypothetical protein